jgi:hypothetical protein
MFVFDKMSIKRHIDDKIEFQKFINLIIIKKVLNSISHSIVQNYFKMFKFYLIILLFLPKPEILV